jgi:gluconate 2-dehydrogenase gamma chain
MDPSSSRRDFLKAVSALGAAALPAAAEPAMTPAPPPAAAAIATHPVHHGASAPVRPGGADAFLCLSAPEVAFVEAAIACLIPADELGPGAREAGVAVFIDRQLAGAFGTGARTYRQGPWPEGTPEQGFQSRLTPREIYRAGIAESDAYCGRRYGRGFDALEQAQREEVLKGLEAGTIALETVSAPLFFSMLLANTQEGFFADPMYGGNRDKAGWSLVGFPGVAAAYIDEIGKHNAPYRVVPVSIGDVQQGHAPVDAHGHAVHTRLDKRR